MAGLYAEYLRRGQPFGLTFKQYLKVIGFINVAEERIGMDDGAIVRAARAAGPQLVSVPSVQVRGPLRVKVLLVDFPDRPGTLPASHYETMLFSKATFPSGSMRDFYQEVSTGKVDVSGSVHGWLRMPQSYGYYTNGRSGTGNTYPRNAQGLAEHAVLAAQAAGVAFEPELDALGQGTVTALFIVHAGVGAEGQTDAQLRANNIWSHKWALRSPLVIGTGLQATVYLTVPNDAKVGVCAHELGHLAFQWEDFYDPNYDEDGSEWDGSGRWDLMAGGSWNGNGARPAHPAGLHKMQHGWVEVQEVKASASLTLEPFTRTSGKILKVVSPQYRPGQYLLLENRKKGGFDSDLPGEGLLVWRVDEAQQMFKPDRPALLLLQADGRHDLERSDDWNEGDAGDPYPGSSMRVELGSDGDLSTTFPGSNDAGVALRNITLDAATGRIALEVVVGGSAPSADTSVIEKLVEPALAIPDNAAIGAEAALTFDGPGAVKELAVDVGITHPYIGDLRVELIAPSGARALLHDHTGGANDNLRMIFRSTETSALLTMVGQAMAGTWRLRVTDSAAADKGTIDRFGVAIAVDRGPGVVRQRRTPNLTIPDRDPAGVADTLVVAEEGIAKGVAVKVDITHTYAGDLRLELVGPSGERALLQDRAGGGTDNIKKTFTSADTPGLAALVGRPVRGSWALRVADLASSDQGKLVAWELEIGLTGATRTAAQEAAPNLAIPDNTPAGIGSALRFDATGTVQALELDAAIEHPYIGDLRVELVAPSGALAVLHQQTGGRTENLTLHLSSSASPALAALVGLPVTGNWVLRVADLASADVGRLRAWSLRVTYA